MGTIGFSGHDEPPTSGGEDERILKRLARIDGALSETAITKT
jgi:hypothetical protein